MNLESLGVVELNAQEVQEVDGGFIPLLYVGYMMGAMLASSAVAVGIAIKHDLQPMWK